MVLAGRLGLETARIPHADRHGLVWLERGQLYVEDGTLRFRAAGSDSLAAGDYAIPFQTLSLVLLGPGGSVSHDALRLLARHGTGLVAVGEGGVRLYSAPQIGPDDSMLARRQARLWADPDTRLGIARRMFALRFGEVPPHQSPDVLRGIEGARIKEAYRLLAHQHRVPWNGRRYDRQNPGAADIPNQAINHAATCVEAAALIAVAATATIPQLGFVHEDSASAFVLDIADLVRTTVTVPVAFAAARACMDDPALALEREVRRRAGAAFRKENLIDGLIDRIKTLFEAEG
ncbi:type I-E CRISPR-associated endonuclease Cas1e [Rhodospirillales bacterium YIM 152171]|uniref:CRISPR-associated endonuclease Cas1 n=1 Tax=Marinimicrococcus flavescens TaxID=3031815 RepID=A0AAP4D4U9_9PROT|nr:type I-E CRISPR-associated endonuclease Cas1e [Marinimicrococcus flavescens]